MQVAGRHKHKQKHNQIVTIAIRRFARFALHPVQFSSLDLDGPFFSLFFSFLPSIDFFLNDIRVTNESVSSGSRIGPECFSVR